MRTHQTTGNMVHSAVLLKIKLLTNKDGSNHQDKLKPPKIRPRIDKEDPEIQWRGQLAARSRQELTTNQPPNPHHSFLTRFFGELRP
jgi:hypothetical protein